LTPYEILEVAADADDATIKRAYRKLARAHHPDKGGDRARFEEINRAYEAVKSAEARKRYDQTGSWGGDATNDPAFVELATFAGEVVSVCLEDIVGKGGGKANIGGFFFDMPERRDDDFDFKALVDKTLVSILATHAEEIGKGQRLIRRCGILRKRMRFTGEGFDHIGRALDDRTKLFEGNIDKLNRQIDLVKRCQAYFAQYGYDMPQATPKPRSWRPRESLIYPTLPLSDYRS